VWISEKSKGFLKIIQLGRILSPTIFSTQSQLDAKSFNGMLINLSTLAGPEL
jgi:hypothetical protein